MSGPFRWLPYVLGALLVAGLVHVSIVLILPSVAASNASARLTHLAERNNAVTALGSGADSVARLPFEDPALVAAACRFDISDGPVRLRVLAGEGFHSVVVLSPRGRVMTSLTDRAATRRLLNIVLLTPEQQRQLEAEDPDDEPVQDIRLRLPEQRGVAVIRALALRESEREPLAAALGRTLCAQD